LLLDTHAFLWWLVGNRKLSGYAIHAIENAFTVYVSPVSGYEIVYKFALGKLPEAAPIASAIPAAIASAGFLALPVTAEHAQLAASLPLVHRDPFDRFLAAQSLIERIPLVSCDTEIDALGATRLWT
jgi:PIN domain nuclease of toxin-antitoxin system